MVAFYKQKMLKNATTRLAFKSTGLGRFYMLYYLLTEAVMVVNTMPWLRVALHTEGKY